MKKLAIYISLFAYLLMITSPCSVFAEDKIYSYEVLEDNTICITGYYGDEKILYIPDTINGYNVSTIGYCAFAYSDCLKTVVIPYTVHTIEDGAFYYALQLTTVYLPVGLQTIGNDAFFGCSKMRSLVVSENTTTIGEYALGYCHFLDPAIPNLVPGVVGIDTEFELYVSPNSAAETYAKENNIKHAYTSSLIKGDISLDGTLATTDIRQLLQLTISSPLAYASWCDADNDGMLSTTDARIYLMAVLA